MVKPLEQIAISFPLSVTALGGLSAIIAVQPPRSIVGFFLSYLFPVVILSFGAWFVTAFSHLFSFSRHPIVRFALPVVGALVLVVCSVWIAVRIGALVHHAL